ncbi:quinone oxidoreductase [Parvibaculum sp.]|uniref:quinone oxidoreductase family protein n=1 Tax=Parvibaculum sp. TaxID=2024848 RepID=UPI000C97C2C1|nr:quinone oxidoreductase [Parvibaculum sp.]MAB15485.1 quinone oxidoreductase [Parvibaculum sp.]
MKIKAIRIEKQGGPDVMKLEEIDLPAPGAGQITVRHGAIGLNYIDTYHRSGLYPLKLPSGIGLEAAGTVEAVGEGVESIQTGDRVAYGMGPVGAYAEAANVPAMTVVKLTDDIANETGAAMMLKGITAHYLLHSTYPVKRGDTILFHAAAGGVGLIVGQWAKHLGATVIGTVGSEAKAELARAHGYDHVINYSEENVVERVKEITGGKMLPVVYDGVGKDTFEISLDCLAPRGLLASFGNASGPVENFDLGLLNAKGSLFVTRPSMMHYLLSPEEIAWRMDDLVDVVSKGIVKIEVNQKYGLADAVQAHKDLESRKTTGSTVLIP